MSNGKVSKIRLPDNTVYDIKTGEPYLDTSYNVTSKTVTLFNSVNDPGYVNLIRFSEEISSDSIYNNGLGYKNGYYVSVGNESANANDCMTGLISYVVNDSQPTDILYIKGYTGAANASHTRLSVRKSDKSTKVTENNGFLSSNNIFDINILGTNYYQLVPKTGIHHNYSDIGYFQFSFNQPDASSIIITRNEPFSILSEAVDTSGNIYNGIGYKNGYRLNSSGAETDADSNYYVTGFIPAVYEDYVYLRNIEHNSAAADATMYRLAFYDSSKNFITGLITNPAATSLLNRTYDEDHNMTSFQVINIGSYSAANVAYFRLSAAYIGEDSIITVNAPLK